jgi:hypothetical protein
MNKGQSIKIARRAIYASSTSSEREFIRTVTSVREIPDQDATIVKLADSRGKVTSYRKEGNYLFTYYPKPAKFEIV